MIYATQYLLTMFCIGPLVLAALDALYLMEEI